MKNKGKVIANEVWNMLPNDIKKQMKNIKNTFLKSIESDVNYIIKKVI